MFDHLKWLKDCVQKNIQNISISLNFIFWDMTLLYSRCVKSFPFFWGKKRELEKHPVKALPKFWENATFRFGNFVKHPIEMFKIENHLALVLFRKQNYQSWLIQRLVGVQTRHLYGIWIIARLWKVLKDRKYCKGWGQGCSVGSSVYFHRHFRFHRMKWNLQRHWTKRGDFF